MTEPQSSDLFPAPDSVEADRSTGLLPSQLLREAVAQGREILSPQPIGDDQIQPASIDLRLSEVAYRVRASFLPGARASVRDKLELLSMHRIDLTGGAVLEKDCVYIVPLLEYVSLKKRTSAAANPKSSTGRLDVFARVITDYGTEFDRVREGYKGPLFAEISPRAFSILVRTGSRLVQLRIRRGSPGFSDTALRRLHEEVGLVDGPAGPKTIRNGLAFTVDVAGDEATGIVGYKARRHTDVIEIDRSFHYDPRDFWEPVYSHKGGIVLDPNDFYVLASREAVVVPPDHAAEMMPYDTFVGEFRVHYAGFFDPGFGAPESGGAGSRAVLEVRSHEVPFLIEDGQIVGRLVYERLIARPDKLYGTPIGSSYQRQGLALSKHFKPFVPR
jgi:dCTP deaminase